MQNLDHYVAIDALLPRCEARELDGKQCWRHAEADPYQGISKTVLLCKLHATFIGWMLPRSEAEEASIQQWIRRHTIKEAS